MNCVSRSMMLWSSLLLWWMFCISPGVSKTPSTVDPFQPLRFQDTDSAFRRRLSQSSRSSDEDDQSCNLTSSQRRQFYNASSQEWIVTDEVLEELDNDIQSIVACTEEDDYIFFSTKSRIKPRRSITIQRRLTMSSQPQRSLFRNGVIAETQRKVRLTCPDSGDLITVRNESITIANMIFTGCNRTGHVVVLDSRCNDQSARGVIQFVHTEFRNNVVSDNQRLLETVDPSCADVVLENVVIRRSQCEFGCMSLSLNNTLESIQLRRNQIVDNDNSIAVPSVFMMPANSETVATNISALRNQIRLFSILDSSFTLRESNFTRNTIISVGQDSSDPIGGSVLLSNSSIVLVSDSIYVDETGWNGGAFNVSVSEFTLTNCTFRQTNADSEAEDAYDLISGTAFAPSGCIFSDIWTIVGEEEYSNQSSSIQVINSRFSKTGTGFWFSERSLENGTIAIESC